MALLILGAVFAAVGLPMVWLARRTFARDRAIAAWPRAPGTVSGSYVHASQERDTEQYGEHYSTWYTPKVRYEYTVLGQKYEGNNIGRVEFQTGQAAARACVDRYPEGKAIEVLHDPNDPKIAYLEVKRSTGAVILLAFGIFWLLLATLLWGLALS